MNETWATIAVFIAGLLIRGIVLLVRIDRRLFSIATNHLPHLYDRMMEFDGKPTPNLDDLK